jgi:hypothetical protein
LQPKPLHYHLYFWASLAHPGRKNNPAVVLFYDFCIYFVKYLRECNSDIGKNFSIENNILFGHTSDKCAISIAFFFYGSRKSFYSKSSKVSLFFFPTFVGMLSLFDKSQSHLFVDLASS